ncbi:hypothetical protein CEE44_03610 [Candidatus Woesearchaeota archaeon B3_Woes]|nr:MAG: hypothetical protein CEE44_03610 [Candidatus Woesearchaeota archaeon B3_Woes]
MPKDDNTPKSVKKYEALKKKAKEILDTTTLSHTEAYTIAADAVLRDEKGIVHYDRLEKGDIQKKFVDQMVGHYIQRANEYFGMNINPEDRMQVDQLLKAYSGVTKTQLEKNLQTYGKNYTVKSHEGMRDELVKEVAKQLNTSAGAHLKDEDAADFVKHMDIEDIVDASKMRVEDILYLHGAYKSGGDALTHKSIKNFYQAQGLPEPVHLKKKEAKKKYKKAD